MWQFQGSRRLRRWFMLAGLGCAAAAIGVIVLANVALAERPISLHPMSVPARISTATPTVAPSSTPAAAWRWPIRNQKFVQGYSASHTAWDLSAPAGTAVFAVAGGRVRRAGWDESGYGNLVVITHENQIETFYAHLEYIVVAPGQVVAAGDQVGVEGGTGHAEGWHLHFEVRVAGVPHDPAEFLVGSDSARN